METWAWKPKVQPGEPSHRAELVERRPKAEPGSWKESTGRVEPKSCKVLAEQVNSLDGASCDDRDNMLGR